MGKLTNTHKHGVRKTNSVVKKKKLKILRKVTNVKCDPTNQSGTRTEPESSNTSGNITSLVSQNYTPIDSSALKAKNITKKDDNFQASEDMNICKIKTCIVPVVPHLQSKSLSPLSPNERSKSEVNNKDQVSKQQKKSEVKSMKKSVKNKIRGVGKRVQKNVKSGVPTKFSDGIAEKCEVIGKDKDVSPTIKSTDELRKDPKPLNQNKKQKRNLKEVRSTEVNEILIGGKVIDSQSYSGKRKKRGKVVGKKVFQSGSKLPHINVEQNLSEESNSSMDSVETSVDVQEEENEDSLENTTVVNEMGDASVDIISPICVEMHREKDAPPNLFYNSMLNYHTHVGKRVVGEKEYSLWKILSGYEKDKQAVHMPIDEGDFGKTNVPRYKKKEVTKEQFIQLFENKILLVLYPGQSVHFSGVLNLKVLVGAIEVLGYEITPHDGAQTVYSPNDRRMLLLQASGSNFNELKYKQLLKTEILEKLYGITEINRDVLFTLPKNSSFMILDLVEYSIFPRFMNKYFPLYFKDVLQTGSVQHNLTSGLKASFVNAVSVKGIKPFYEHTQWVDVEQRIFSKTGPHRVMVFGGKSVGKSTFLRVLINRIIRREQRILYIDLDPGQSEFTPPGFVSAVLVEKPLLGPNFTHLKDPERSVFVGRVNIAKCPWEYLQSVEHILKWCNQAKSVQRLTWFINTMGFTKGVGVDLAIAAIKCVCPTDLIQMTSDNKKQNFPFDLTSSNINTAGGQSLSTFQTNVKKYTFHSLSSGGPYTNLEKPSHLREVAVLAYFSKIVLGSRMSLLGANVYEFPFNGLKLCICHEKVNPTYYLSAMNANVVGLCNAGAREGLIPNDNSYPQILMKPPICDCYGLGIVRGVDMKARKVFIVSPVPSVIIRKVNCLVLGEVFLPANVYIKQSNIKGSIPYVVVGSNQSYLEKSIELKLQLNKKEVQNIVPM